MSTIFTPPEICTPLVTQLYSVPTSSDLLFFPVVSEQGPAGGAGEPEEAVWAEAGLRLQEAPRGRGGGNHRGREKIC
jgi:hypothetical protein